MVTVDTIARVRRAYFVQGRKIKAIARELRLARGIDVCAERPRLNIARALVVEIIKAGLADRHAFGMGGERDKHVCRHILLLMGVVRMRADGTEHRFMGFGNGADLRFEPQACADRDHAGDTGRQGAFDLVVARDERRVGRPERDSRVSSLVCSSVRTIVGATRTRWLQCRPK